MRYQQVCLEAASYVLPDEILTSDEIEERLRPLYERLRLPAGRLELMTGIRERRLFPAGALPSEASARAVRQLLTQADFPAECVGALIHGSVCRDLLEPATACRVHRAAGLSSRCHVYDVSNACLGLANGILQVANLIELGQIRAGVVVGTETARDLLETTIRELNADLSLTRDDVKLAIASLTIGSASAAVLLVHRSLSRTGNRLLGGHVWAESEHVELCCGTSDEGLAHASPLMRTDSQRLLHAGLSAAQAAYADFLAELGWSPDELDKSVCHQVGHVHRRMLLESLGLDAARDYCTFPSLGNTGSAALPVTLARAAESGHFDSGDRVGLLGIGSGVNVVMLGLEWQRSLSGRQDSPRLTDGIAVAPR